MKDFLRPNLILGTQGPDLLTGTDLRDIILGFRGRDDIRAGDGDDIVIAGPGDDGFVAGGPGNDLVFGGQGKDFVVGSDGNDTVFGGQGIDRIGGDAGDDRLFGGAGGDFLDGGFGNDEIRGGAGADQFIFDVALDQGTDTLPTFDRSEDILNFTEAFADITDQGAPGYADDIDAISTISDEGPGGDVILELHSGTRIVFEKAGTGQIASVADLVDDPLTQIVSDFDVFSI